MATLVVASYLDILYHYYVLAAELQDQDQLKGARTRGRFSDQNLVFGGD